MPRQSATSGKAGIPRVDDTGLAANLRRLRVEANLTLDQLAKCSGVSRAMISKIERGASVPTATVFGKLAAALKIGLSQLMCAPRACGPRLLKRGMQPVYHDPTTGFERRSLSPLMDDGAVDLALNLLPPLRSVLFPAHHTGVVEFLFVTEGILTVVLDGEPFVVSEGDTLFFPADRTHEFRNETDRTATFYVVVDDRSKR